MLWPTVESQMASLLAAIMRVHSDTTIAVYLSLRRSTSRKDAISKAASIALDSHGLEMLEAILLHARSLEAERNALSHGHWGVCDTIKDGILWVSSENGTLFAVDWNAKSTKDSMRKFSGREFDEFREKLYLYDKKDLTTLKRQINDLAGLLATFRSYVASYHGDLSPSSGQEALSLLSAYAPIREALRTLKLRAQEKSEKERCLKPKRSQPRSKHEK